MCRWSASRRTNGTSTQRLPHQRARNPETTGYLLTRSYNRLNVTLWRLSGAVSADADTTRVTRGAREASVGIPMAKARSQRQPGPCENNGTRGRPGPATTMAPAAPHSPTAPTAPQPPQPCARQEAARAPAPARKQPEHPRPPEAEAARAPGYAVLVGSKRRRLCALAAASPRLATPSLPRMLDTWTLAVLGEMNSSPAISLLLRPAATRRSTSSSRSVSPSPSRTASAAPPTPKNGTALGTQPDPGAPGQDGDLLAERPRGEPPASGAARCSRSAAPSRSPQASAASAACSSVSPSG